MALDMELYNRAATVPSTALKEITFGSLKGKSDINPQWRYEIMTEIYGLCGVGWKWEVVKTEHIPVTETGELMIYVMVNVWVKDLGKWSELIPGFGGDFVIKKDKNGIHGNDEALKIAVTDALGTALKMVGVAADVYRGFTEIKNTKEQENRAEIPNIKRWTDTKNKALKQNIQEKDLLDFVSKNCTATNPSTLTDEEFTKILNWIEKTSSNFEKVYAL